MKKLARAIASLSHSGAKRSKPMFVSVVLPCSLNPKGLKPQKRGRYP